MREPKLKTAARAAAAELRQKPLPADRPATRAFAELLGVMIHKRGLRKFHEGLWRALLKVLDMEIECPVDVYFWLCGIAQAASELAVTHPADGQPIESLSHVPESNRVSQILRICDGIVRVKYRPKAKRKLPAKSKKKK